MLSSRLGVRVSRGVVSGKRSGRPGRPASSGTVWLSDRRRDLYERSC